MLTLSELHELVSGVWLTRHDVELEEERATRRKGRPKGTREQKLEEVKLREAEEYRTGMGELSFTSPGCASEALMPSATGVCNQRYLT